MPVKGTCNCGAVTVTINEDESEFYGEGKKRGHLCHCENCRKTAGSTYGSNLVIERSKVKFSGEGNLTVYEDRKTGSGNPVYRSFCKTCGNPIRSELDAMKDKVILKMGIFTKIPAPEMETFAKDRFEWLPDTKGVKMWKVAPGGELVKET